MGQPRLFEIGLSHPNVEGVEVCFVVADGYDDAVQVAAERYEKELGAADPSVNYITVHEMRWFVGAGE